LLRRIKEDFSKFLDSLVLSPVEGLLLCIKTKKLEKKNDK